MKLCHSFAIVILALAGCSTSGIVEMAPGTYMLSRSSAAGMFANMPKMKAEVIREANAYAESKGKVAEEISMHDTFPTHGFPSVEYQFRLVPRTNTPSKQ